ncbi:Retrovirus-related Pol polyprotein from transposon 17.6 [Araneus ventricosus]|uniref:RNA-directed DNA polymerase n=1 Tax=Araneus ventricosus TaxID=182803 RepID=A0A4Y2GCW8_ARAVE|nr:Retrovirus-related Pol polyprotein from transposon 17.6 [Araneus ventricosus]
MSKPYRTSPRQNEILQKEIQKMLSMKIIEIGYPDYTSPMILVEGPGKEPRPCVDYRNLNKITKTKFYPLPNIEERIETISSAKYITVLDLSKGYWQIPMSKNAQRLSAFVTNFGTYIPLRMPFGLKNAPYEFSRMVAQLLEACEDFAVPYLDDIAVFSVMFQEHIKHLETVLQRIQQADLTIKPSKCKFAQSQVQYLGHTVGQECRRPSELKIEAVKNFPTPQTKTDIRAFLGLAGYYSHYIPMFSTIAAPLTDALKGKCRKGVVHWTEDCEKAFNSLKQALASQPVLHSPDYNRQFILQTDASDNGIGVVLSQVNEDDKEHPIVYLSRKFSDVEKRYCVSEKECAAIIFGIQRLKYYLDGQAFTIVTDHNPLTWLKTNASKNARILRWSLALQPFNFVITHRRGTQHKNADALSRILLLMAYNICWGTVWQI